MFKYVFSNRMPAGSRPDLESAATPAKGCSALRGGGGVEVGPVMDEEGA